jgi:transposase
MHEIKEEIKEEFPMNEEFNNHQTEEQREADFKKRYDEEVQKLVNEHGFTPRKARRYLNSMSNRMVRKWRHQAFKNRNMPKIYIDPASVDLTEE